MSYTTTSQLEREARSKGDPLIWRAYFKSFSDSPEHVRNKCYSILAENPEGAKQAALEKLVEKGGVWIDVDPEYMGFIHIHGVRDQIGDTTPYTLSWRRRRYIRVLDTGFTEAQLLSHLYDSDEYLPSAKQVDGTLRAIETARAQGNNTNVIERFLEGLSGSIKNGMHTSTHIENGTLIHGWGRPNPEHIKLPRIQSGTARVEIIMHHIDTTIMHLLGSTDTRKQIQQRYALLSDFESTRAEFLLEGDVHVMITGGGNNPVRYYTASDVNTMGVARLVKKTPIAKPN